MASASEAGACAEAGEGPVMSLVSKRLRALRKKQKRIAQMEAALAGGKPLNPEQSETLRSKPAVEVLIEEYERLRAPLAAALHDELLSLPSPPHKAVETEPEKEAEAEEGEASAGPLEDLVALMYFGAMFDVKPQQEFTATMLARALERGCCLTYDCVPDDDDDSAAEMLAEADLDAISALQGLVTSRPMRSGASHQAALRDCFRHARLWLARSDQPVHPGSTFTYAGLRGRLDKILSSDYFTRTPEIKGGEDLAAAAGKYTIACPVQIPDAAATKSELALPTGQVEDDPVVYQQKEDEMEDFQVNAVEPDHFDAADETPNSDEAEVLNPSEENATAQHEQQNLEADVEEHNQRETEFKDQQYFPRKPYQSQRGGARGGGRRGYPNGRGRGGRGGVGYQNGRSQYYDSGYHPRNYYNTRGRGGRSGGSAMYNNHGGRGPVNGDMGTGM